VKSDSPTRGAERGAHEGVGGGLRGGVGHHHRVVLGAHVALHALARRRRARVHVLARGVAADERHGADVRVVADAVHHRVRAVHHVQYPAV
jgi:hypothetical protein